MQLVAEYALSYANELEALLSRWRSAHGSTTATEPELMQRIAFLALIGDNTPSTMSKALSRIREIALSASHGSAPEATAEGKDK
jgi:hypothetical protein